MILKLIIVFVLIVVIALIANGIEDSSKSVITIPFEDSMNSVGVPIATFVHNGKELNFLLDTGGDYSYIDQSIISELKAKKRSKKSISVVTGSGSMSTSGKITIEMSYDGNSLEEEFIISDIREGLESAFGNVMKVHGVLGSSFFNKYGYVIDFSRLKVSYKV